MTNGYPIRMTRVTGIATTVIAMDAEDEKLRPKPVGKASYAGDAVAHGGGQQDSRLRRLAKATFDHMPTSLRQILSPLARLYSIFNEIRPRFWIAESQGREDATAVAVLCAAQGRDRSYLLRQFLGNAYRERCLGRRWLWNIPEIVAGEGRGCCVAVVKTLGRFHRFLGPHRWLLVPAWVSGEVDCVLDPAVLKMETVKSDLRRIRRNSLGFRVTRDVEQFEDFYRHMYVPYVTDAHGDSAVVTPYASMKMSLEDSELLLVTKEDQAIAGLLISYSQAGPRLRSMGIRDANKEYVRDGAVGALYHFSFHYLREKGFDRVNLGLSRPLLHDGALRYKKKLGMRLSRVGKEWFAVRVLEDSKAARMLLEETPLIFERDGLLYGLICADASAARFSDKDLEWLDRQYSMEGLARLLVISLGCPCHSATVPPELAERITVCRAVDVL
jgi:hypothetical protein